MAITIDEVRIVAVVAIALLYAIFDVFNRRNVPDAFVYAALGAGVVLAFTWTGTVLTINIALALLIGSIGYVLYRQGMWGAGDFFELVTISLIIPIQPVPMLNAMNQASLPFIFSVFITTGLSAVWIVPIYYLLIKKREGRARRRRSEPLNITQGSVLAALYVVLFVFTFLIFGFSWGRMALIAGVAFPSALILVYEKQITDNMTQMVQPKELEESDIIAMNRMSTRDIAYFTRKYKGFGRLITKEAIAKLKRVTKKLPVYRDAAPLALFILIGVVVSLLFGDLILYLVY